MIALRFAVRLATLTAIFAACALPLAHAQAPIEIIFGISAEAGSLQALTGEEFTRRVNQKLAGKANVKFFASSQLGGDKELMQKLRLGSVHLSMPSSNMSSVSPEFALFDMPFLIKDRAQLARIAPTVFWQMIAPSTEPKGYKILGLWENGFRQITNNTRPIDKPEDLKGIKLRVPGGAWRVKMFKLWGANPTPMAFSEVFVGLQTGVIDGQENPYTNIYAAKFQEVQKYLSITNHVYTPSYLTTGTTTWANWPQNVRDVIAQTAKEMEAWAYEKGAQDDGVLKDKLVAAGMKVNTADRAAFVKASQPLYDEFEKEVPNGKAMIEATLRAAN
jgi:tripartite ATP-independent transporter DctP family solute receptor